MPPTEPDKRGLIDRIKYDGEGAECEACRIDTQPGETRCPRCGKPFAVRPWLVYKYPYENLVMGSQLIVNQSQEALFFRDGRALDVLGPGLHVLSTENIPLLQKLVNLPFGGKTPFAAEVYFVNKTTRLDMKWGTTDPIPIEDPKYGMVFRIRAHGQFGIRIADSRNLVTQLVGVLQGNQASDYQQVGKYFRGLVLTRVKNTIADTIVNKRASLLDITASLSSLSEECQQQVAGEFGRFGIETVNFFIASINAPDEDLAQLQEVMRGRAELDILGDGYDKKRRFDVAEKAAGNPAAGSMAGIIIGAGLGQSTGDIMRQATAPANTKCPSCGVDNPIGAKFCSQCGKDMVQAPTICHKCGKGSPRGTNFCGDCGASLQTAKCPKCDADVLPETKFCSNCGCQLRGG